MRATIPTRLAPLASTSTLPPLSVPKSSAIYNSPSYFSKYRNPYYHNQPPQHKKLEENVVRTVKRISRDETGNPSNGGARERRLEMERMWSGGEASPPIPEENSTESNRFLKPKHALLFVGTGSQYVGMGKALENIPAAKEVYREAEEALEGFEDWRRGLKLGECEGQVGELGRLLERSTTQRLKERKLRAVIQDGPQHELTRSFNAQPAILITSIAFVRTLEQEYSTPVCKDATYFAGHSSGEYSAAVAAGAISLTDAVRLTRLHGLLTSELLSLPSVSLSAHPSAEPASKAQMSALILNPGHSHAEVAEIVASISNRSGNGVEGVVEIASYNSTSQIILGGAREAILRACAVLKELNIAAHAADLPVGAPFHCSFMAPAAEGMRHALHCTNILPPTAPLLNNLDGLEVSTPSSLIQNLVQSMSESVRWSSAISYLKESEVNRLIFFGPGAALANLATRDLKVFAKAEGVQVDTEVISVATEEGLRNAKASFELDLKQI